MSRTKAWRALRDARALQRGLGLSDAIMPLLVLVLADGDPIIVHIHVPSVAADLTTLRQAGLLVYEKPAGRLRTTGFSGNAMRAQARAIRAVEAAGVEGSRP